jgi:hypothetical protein
VYKDYQSYDATPVLDFLLIISLLAPSKKRDIDFKKSDEKKVRIKQYATS